MSSSTPTSSNMSFTEAAEAKGSAAPTPWDSTRAWWRRLRCPLYAQVLLAMALGVLLGWLLPDVAAGQWVECLGTGFVKLIKMAIAPIIFCTLVSGISHVGDAAQVGRVAIKAIVYFEVVSTAALGVGLVVAEVVRPGEGMDAKPDEAAVEKYQQAAAKSRPADFLLHVIPDTAVGAFAEGDILQVLFFAILFGFALMAQGERARTCRVLIDEVAHVMFGVVAIIMKAAPVGAFGAMAHMVGKYGVGTLANLLMLVGTFYLTAVSFVLVVLGAIAALAGVNIVRLLAYIKDELLLVVATSSSESALPTLLEKLERLGCSKPIVGLVVPLGYSFNLDGTNIYMTLATLFIGQAMGVHPTFAEKMKILVVAMLTSKGAAGVSGAGFVTLASTLAAVRPDLVPGMAILLGVDKFMAECRSLTNLIGNAVACVVMAASEGELDRAKMRAALSVGPAASDKEDDLEQQSGADCGRTDK